jgi:FkbM family methyltransferase
VKPAPIDPPEIWNELWEGFSGNTGWDVGANCGQTLMIMLDRFKKVYAFEPAKECWPYLAGYPEVIVEHFGLSDKDGLIDLIALPDKIDTGQLITAGTHGMEWDPDDPGGLLRQVPGRTIDSICRDRSHDAPDFMKIDVEGHELKVLFGARRTLNVFRPQLLIEFHTPDLHKDVRQLLETYGYHCDTVRHPHYPPGSDMWSTHGWLKCRVD